MLRTINGDKYNSELIQNNKNEIKQNDLTMTKTNKGKCAIVLKKLDYDRKVINFIATNNFISIEFNLNSL